MRTQTFGVSDFSWAARIAGLVAIFLIGSVAMLGSLSAAEEASQPAAPTVVDFDSFFENKALRLEMYQTGDAKDEIVTLHEIYEEPIWPESPRSLIPKVELGRYALRVRDAATHQVIYVRYFDTMFAEYVTTSPAIKGTKRVFEMTARMPLPKKPVRVGFERRDKQNVLHEIFSTNIDPSDYHILRETANRGDTTFEVQKTGDPHDRVDLVYLAEGYTAADQEKFKADVERMSAFLFTVEPYQANREKFNVYGVFRASADRATDEPRQHKYQSTALNSSYNAFDLDRYLLVEENHAIHRMAAAVPYDTIIILVNTPRYGGGSICLDYCISSVDHPTSPKICVHEFGHSFAYLADEYIGNVAYNDVYTPGVEPLEPNITELLDPKNVKWKSMLTEGVALPTSDGNSELKSLKDQLAAAEKDGASADKQDAIRKQVAAAEEYIAKLPTTVGAFEGAGYLSKGMYRAQIGCWMGAQGPSEGFCVACKQGIQQMIDFYSPPTP